MGEKELPVGWISTSLKNVVITKKGKKPKMLSDIEFENSVPYLDIKALEKNEIRQYADVESSNLLEARDIAILWDGARSGWVSKGKAGAIGSTLVALKPILVNTNYIFYFLKSKFDLLNTNTRGSGIPHVDPAVLWNLEFLLPPLAEQNRIVEKLDKLFASIEIVKAKLDIIPQLVKNFRQAVLSQAVKGNLTEKWREGRCELDDWKQYNFNDLVLNKARNGFSPKAVDYITEVKSLTLAATTSGKFNPKYVKYLDIKKPDKNSHLWLKKGDILIQRANSLEYVGTAVIYNGEDDDFIYPDLMMKIQVNELILNEFLLYNLSSPSIKQYFKDVASGTSGNMPKINQGTISAIQINLPSLDEQFEIISRVNSLLAKVDVIEEKYQILKVQLGSLPQVILGKAFRGELVKQDFNDGLAENLLREIERLKQSVKK
ncbi:hypothetical protein AQ505_09055 [Pedobacter sp. PACM 27299]|uniref:restriction endonuclease subunit S n=1 Tax=Pedobacter sp. PACM 27299 TaxID=1727164 RepID=UPI000706C7EA|nr:restriction endonuclease subunit S [Pedobacter sp. PACM 27299]ALL05628.1 hypothetical protein AQ505_09055 [Pedobacter sp. PACM 27299]